MEILYEDNHIIVVVKEAGILAQADNTDRLDLLSMIKDYIKIKYNKPGNVFVGLVHRLDTYTKGIMVYAKTSKAASRLSADISNHEFNKKYIARVEGRLNNKEFIKLEANLSKNEAQKKAFIDKSGKYSSLEYRVIKNYKIDNHEFSDLEIILHSGRFHQIRCMLSNIGHPLAGDIKYGSKLDKKYYKLIEYYLSFMHPTKKELMEFQIGDE